MQPDVSILIDHRANSNTLKRVLYSIYKQQVCHVCEVIILCAGNSEIIEEYCHDFTSHSMMTFRVCNVSHKANLLDIFDTTKGKMILYLSSRIIIDSDCIDFLWQELDQKDQYTVVAPKIIPEPELSIPKWISPETLKNIMPQPPILATLRENIASVFDVSIGQIPHAQAYCYIPARDLTLYTILQLAYKRGQKRSKKNLSKRSMRFSDFLSTAWKMLFHIFLRPCSATRVNLLQLYCESLGYFLQAGSRS